MITKTFNKNQFSVLALPYLNSVPIGLRTKVEIIHTRNKLILKYFEREDEIFLLDFIKHKKRKQRLILALNLMRLIQSINEIFVIDFSPENFVLNQNLNIRFIHLGVQRYLAPAGDTQNDFLRLKNLLVFILNKQKYPNKNDLTLYLNIDKFSKKIYSCKTIPEINLLILKKLRTNIYGESFLRFSGKK